MGSTPVRNAEEATGEANSKIDLAAESDDKLDIRPVVLDEAQITRLIELSPGLTVPCFQCGACTAACPWGIVRDETFSVRLLVRAAQLSLETTQDQRWLCTACGQCQQLCPRGVDISQVIRGVRYLAWQERTVPSGLPTVLWSLVGNNNPWGQPPSTRSAWASDLGIPFFDARQHEILLYAGCTAAYDPRIQQVAHALVSILRAAGVTFGYLADNEPCCGESALSLGHQPFFNDLVNKVANCFEQYDVRQVVTISPHCLDALVAHYADSGHDIEVSHYSHYLAWLLEQGQLSFDGSVFGRVTFHDPCYLARRHQDETSARTILAALPGAELVEMAHHGGDTICCGGGGGRMWLETAPDERIADVRIAEAVQVDADWLITACPFCLMCLEDSRRSQNLKDMRILDLAEIVSLTLNNAERPPASMAPC